MKTFKELGIESYPLSWPVGWKRERYRTASKFKTSFSRARTQLFNELKLFGCPDSNVVLSSNIPLRKDGLPYSGLANPTDPGFAVYFRWKDKPMVFACDQYKKVEDNLYAIVKTIEAMRGIRRWGSSDMMERSFTGFAALPPAASSLQKREWWEVLRVTRNATASEIGSARRRLMEIHHPDRGGDPVKAAEINKAYEEAMND